MNIAREEATKSAYKQRHGAVVYNRQRILGKGHNKTKTHPKARYYYTHPFIHAEFDAVVNAGNVKDCTVAVVRISGSGDLMLSKPCQECMFFLKKRGIKYIVYSDSCGGFKKIEL